MSEKRFTLNLMKKPSEIEMDGKMISKYDVVRLLNEQQATIEQQKENMKYLNERIDELLNYIKLLGNRKKEVENALRTWYVELIIDTPMEHSLWVKNIVRKYHFLEEWEKYE